jgi:hypothetical protein
MFFYDHSGTGSYWATNGSQTGWVKLDLGNGNAQTVEVLGIRNSDTQNRAPHDFTLQGTNAADDSDWHTVLTVIDQTSWTVRTVRFFDVTSPASYRYYKLDVTANNGDGYLAIGEIYLFGAEPSAAATANVPAVMHHLKIMRGCQ